MVEKEQRDYKLRERAIDKSLDELSQKRSPYLKPKCIKDHRPKGVGYSSLGWLIPCCWMDNRKGELDNYSAMDNPLFAALFTEELKLSNVDKIEDIIYSEPWKEFGRALLHEPEICPTDCHKYCGSDLPDDGFVYENQNIPVTKMAREKARAEAEKDGTVVTSQTYAWNRAISRHYPPEASNDRAEDDGLKRYVRLKAAGMLPRHHYTDQEWDDLDRIREYHKWAEDNDRPIGGAHESKVNFRNKKVVSKGTFGETTNTKGLDDEDFR